MNYYFFVCKTCKTGLQREANIACIKLKVNNCTAWGQNLKKKSDANQKISFVPTGYLPSE